MKKHFWLGLAALCAVACIVTAAVFVPRVFRGSGASPIDDRVVVMPDHWYKTNLNEQQLETLRGLWGTPMTLKHLIDALWPGVLQGFPQEITDSLADEAHQRQWPYQTFEDFVRIQEYSAGQGVWDDEGRMMWFTLYLGEKRSETEIVFGHDKKEGLTSDRIYQISLYTDDVLPSAYPEGS